MALLFGVKWIGPLLKSRRRLENNRTDGNWQEEEVAMIFITLSCPKLTRMAIQVSITFQHLNWRQFILFGGRTVLPLLYIVVVPYQHPTKRPNRHSGCVGLSRRVVGGGLEGNWINFESRFVPTHTRWCSPIYAVSHFPASACPRYSRPPTMSSIIYLYSIWRQTDSQPSTEEVTFQRIRQSIIWSGSG